MKINIQILNHESDLTEMAKASYLCGNGEPIDGSLLPFLGNAKFIIKSISLFKDLAKPSSDKMEIIISECGKAQK